MARPRCIYAFMAVALPLLAMADPPQVTGGEPLVAITRADPRLPNLTTRDLAAIYLGDAGFVRGVPVYPVDYHRTVAIRNDFLKQVIGMRPGAYETHWIKAVFRTGGVPPIRANSVDAALKQVRKQRGAIAYVPASAVNPDQTELAVIWRQPEMSASSGPD